MENEQTTGGAPGANSSNQSLPDDLKKVADRAKSASQGFSFEKLFEGRLDQMNYLYGAIGSIILGYLLMYIPFIGFLIGLALAVLMFGMTARRLHDINTTGWASLILLIPLIGLLMVLYLCWKVGDVAANPFGAVPDPKRDLFKAILNT